MRTDGQMTVHAPGAKYATWRRIKTLANHDFGEFMQVLVRGDDFSRLMERANGRYDAFIDDREAAQAEIGKQVNEARQKKEQRKEK